MLLRLTCVKCIQVLPSNGEKNCDYKITEYTMEPLPKNYLNVYVCDNACYGDKVVITLFHKDCFYEISGNNNLSKLFSFLYYSNV